jgi:glycosyltransferase involved in cell wall biosynthesis
MDSFKPDVIHINSEFVIGYFGLNYARHRKVPMVYTFHTLWEDYAANYIHFLPQSYSKKLAKEFIRFYLKRSDMIICPTERIQNVVKNYKIDRESKILPTGIPNHIAEIKKGQKQLFHNQLYKGFPLKKKKRILLYVGRVVKEKNLEFLFPVLDKVKKVYPDTMLVIVGGGPELEPLQKKATELKLSKNICFTGYQNRDDLAYFYKLADVFVFPSVTETQGLVTIEAMMTGLPVVAIGEMGTVDVMQGNNGGFMVKNDVTEFYEKVIELLSNKELHKQKCEEALAWSKKWSLPDLTNTLVEYYEEAIEIRKNR